MTKRLRRLIALAGFSLAFAACGSPEDVTPVESATSFPNITAQKNAVWSYYTGVTNGLGAPQMIMFQPDKSCSPLPLGNGLYAYRIPSFGGGCLWDTGSQVQQSPYDFWATYEIWQDRQNAAQMPWYATLAVNFLCMAAYERVGYSYSQAFPYCDGSASSTVPTVRHLIHDLYYAGTPFWQ